MTIRFDKSLSVRLLAVASALTLSTVASQAQTTFFGSGGGSNSAANVLNLAFGYNALFSNTTGQYNTAVGSVALASSNHLAADDGDVVVLPSPVS